LKNVEQAGAAGCTRLLVASQWTPTQSAVGTLLARRRELLQRARQSGVRTALLSASGWLVQWHEGSEAAVAAEWQRLRADPLQRSPLVMHSSTGPAVLRDAVQITSLHAPETPTDVARRLHALARDQEQGWSVAPAQIWQALVAPCRLGRAGVLGRLAPRTLLAVVSEKNEAVELVRRLAHQHRVDVSYQRYADCNLERGDVGAAYADVPRDAARITRVQALPRLVLEGGTLLLGVPHVDRLLVLLGTDASRGRALLTQVTGMLDTLPQTPEVQLVCRCPDALRHAREALESDPGWRGSLVAAQDSAFSAADLTAAMLDPSESEAPASAMSLA
jgi:hypothetical protein